MFIFLSIILALVCTYYLATPFLDSEEIFNTSSADKGEAYQNMSRDLQLDELKMELETDKITSAQFETDKQKLLNTNIKD